LSVEEVNSLADRSVTARLRLVYTDFTKGTKAAADGLKGIGDEAGKTARRTDDSWVQLGKSVAGLGDSLTTRVTLPLVGLGAVAVKAAGDFDAAFVQMQTLAGVSADEVDGLKDSVLDLAGETGKAPQELADALFFLQSSGLDAAGAMDALEISAKASAAGLGDTVTLADAASSVMLAYAESGMTAAEAMDTLIATAKAGKAEPEAIAGQLSKLIPISAALDISFQDVGGALAALSTKAFSAEQGATGLAAVMSKLMKPSQQAQEQLDAVGLSGDRLKDLLAEQGLLGTLNTLKERLGDNGFVRFLEDQEAIRAGVALTTGDMEKMEEIFGQVADSAGSTDKAFATWAESMGAQNAKAFADFQVALIKLGEIIAPIAADLMSFAASLVGVFGDLPDPVQKTVLALAGIAVAIGPVLSVGGRLVGVLRHISDAFDFFKFGGGDAFADAMNKTSNSSSRLGGRLRNIAGLVAQGGTIVTGFMLIGEAAEAAFGRAPANLSKLERDLLDFGESTKISGELAKVAGDDLGSLGDAFNEVFDPSLGEQVRHINDEIGSLGGLIAGDLNKLDEAEAVIDDVDKALASLAGRDPELAAKVFDNITDALVDMGVERDQVTNGFNDYEAALAETETANRTAEGATKDGTEALADQEQQINETAEAFSIYADQLKAAFDPAFGMVDALRQNEEAFVALEEAQRNLNEVQKDGESTAADVAEAQRGVEDAMLGTEESALGVHVAAATLNAALAENPALIEDVKASLEQMREQGLIPNIETLGFLGGSLDEATLKAIGLGQTDPVVDVSERGARRTRSELATIRDTAASVPTRRNTHLSTTGGAAAADAIGRMISLISQVPTTKTVNLQARAGAGWGNLFGVTGNRAAGGPVDAGRLYRVAEQGRAELLRMGGETFLIPGSDGYIDPALSGHMTSASASAGTSVTNVFDMRGAIITGGERQFRQMVAKAMNTEGRKGRGLNAA
jgi:TP901 family phage tail tape measure protein